MSSKRSGRYEFGSPTFKRLDDDSVLAAPAANTSSNAAGGSASIQVQQQPTQASSSPLLQQIMAQPSHPPAPNPLTSRVDANAITSLFPNSQPCTLNQQTVLSNQLNDADANRSTHPPPSQQTLPNQANRLNNADENNYLQSFQQWQHPNPTMNLLSTTGQMSSAPQLMGYSSSLLIDPVNALMSLSGISSQPTLSINNNTSPGRSQPNNMAVQSLLLLLQRVGEEELQRRAQVDAIQDGIMTTIRQILAQGGFPNNNIAAHPEQGIIPSSRQTVGSNLNYTQPQQVGTLPPSAGNLNIQADVDDNEGKVGGPLSPRKRQCPDDDQYDADDDGWNRKLRPRKKSPRK